MRYTKLGHSGIEVSRICLGGMSFGVPTPDHHQWTIDPDEKPLAGTTDPNAK